MSLRAVLRDSIRSDGTRAIKIRIQKNRDVTYINTGLSIVPEKFDQKKGQARDSYSGAAGINAKISALLSRYNQTLELFEGRGAINDVKKIRDLLLSYDSDGQKYLHSTESTGFFLIADLLILDDFGMQSLDSQSRGILMDIIEDRHQKRSIMITSQVPVKGCTM